MTPPAPVQANQERTRSRILEAAEDVFADNGYHDAIIEEIGRRTDISKGGLYFHFPSKEDLFFAVLDRLADRLVAKSEAAAAGDGVPLERAESAIRAVLASLSRRRRLARLIVLQGYSMGNQFERKRAEIFDRFAAVIERTLTEAIESGEARDADAEIASRVWLGAVNETVINWLHNGGPSPAQQADEICRLLLDGTRSAGASR